MLEKSLNFQQYQDAALQTAGAVSLVNAALGLCGESGEFADVVKKATFQGHFRDTDKLVNELGDILWYVALAAKCLNISLAEVAELNIQKLRARYPDGKFSEVRSVQRAD